MTLDPRVTLPTGMTLPKQNVDDFILLCKDDGTCTAPAGFVGQPPGVKTKILWTGSTVAITNVYSSDCGQLSNLSTFAVAQNGSVTGAVKSKWCVGNTHTAYPYNGTTTGKKID